MALKPSRPASRSKTTRAPKFSWSFQVDSSEKDRRGDRKVHHSIEGESLKSATSKEAALSTLRQTIAEVAHVPVAKVSLLLADTFPSETVYEVYIEGSKLRGSAGISEE